MPPGIFCNSSQICPKLTKPLACNGLPFDRLMTPTLKAAGSNPVGRTKNRRRCIAFGGFCIIEVSCFAVGRWRLYSSLFHLWKPPRLRHTLVQNRSAVPTDHILQPVAQESVLSEGHDGLVLLPADPKIIRSAPGAMVDGDLRLFRFAAVYQISNLSCRT